MYFLCLFFCAASAVRLQYVDLNKTKVDVNVSTVDISARTFSTDFFWLYVIKYQEKEEQLETVSNISRLEHIDIYSVGQMFMPIFRDLPKIKHIAIKGNNIFYLTNGAISQVPVQEVYLDNNRIEYIDTWSIGPEVNTLYLSCNKIKKFSQRWFTNALNLRELDLSGNDITSLPKDIFKPFVSLSLIALSHNKISTIGTGAFSNRNSFWILYLDNNKLTELPTRAFQKGSLEIHSIHLQYNKLTYLEKEFIKKTNTTRAKVVGNPWQCACYSMIKKWNSWESFEQNKESKGRPKCIPAPSYEPRCVPEVDFEVIEEYESKYPPKETREHFCKTYLK